MRNIETGHCCWSAIDAKDRDRSLLLVRSLVGASELGPLLVELLDSHAPAQLGVLYGAFVAEEAQRVDVAALVEVVAPDEELVAAQSWAVVGEGSRFRHSDPAGLERLAVRLGLQTERLLPRLGLRVEDHAHARLVALHRVVDPQDAADVDLDAGFLYAFAQGARDEALAEVDGASWDPPTTVPRLLHGDVLAVGVHVRERIPHDDQTELEGLEHRALRRRLRRCHLRG